MSKQRLDRERWALLHNVIRTFEPVMAVLGVVWTLLVVVDFTRGLTFELAFLSHATWVIFAAGFVAELLVAPRRWTAMIMTTMGSAYWPQTVEGRVLCVRPATYSFAMFGYVTATVSTFLRSEIRSRR